MIASKIVHPDFLLSIEALKEVPVPQLQWFIDQSEIMEFPDGGMAFEPGDRVKSTLIVLEGSLTLSLKQNGNQRNLNVVEPGEITGYLPFSRGKTALSYGQAAKNTRLLAFPIEKMLELIQNHFELTQALVHVMTSRVRDFTALQQQNEKMMALGKLSAGLAHELNNPAAAIVRGSSMLKKHLQLQPDTFKAVIAIKMGAEEVDLINHKMFEILSKGEKPFLSMMERADKEDEVVAWLDQYKVSNAFEIAENFVEFGFRMEDLDFLSKHIPAEHISPVFNWINNNLVTEKMVQDIQESSERISRLVNSVKNFTHMDRSNDLQEADIHAGIRNTLTMLNHKIVKANVKIKENYDMGLGPVKAMIGELNQVWTNLIDNAIDAMEPQGSGILEIKTLKDGEFVRIYIIDNGTGIPKDIQSKIFDPFFTTKEVGKGTGLGLDVVFRIVSQHNGDIKVESEPGRTEFMVCLPIGNEQ